MVAAAASAQAGQGSGSGRRTTLRGVEKIRGRRSESGSDAGTSEDGTPPAPLPRGARKIRSVDHAGPDRSQRATGALLGGSEGELSGKDVLDASAAKATGLRAAVRHLAAGGLAGAVSKTATAPMECIRLQLMTGTGATLSEVCRSTWGSGGIRAFFRGNLVDVARGIPSKSIQLTAYELYKQALTRLFLSKKRALGSTTPPPPPPTTTPAPISAVAGGLAGITATTVCFPLETMRTRLAVSGGGFRAMATLIRVEGLGVLYAGLGASIFGVVPYAAANLAGYDALRAAYRRYARTEVVSPALSLLFGAASACLASSASFPLEVVRRRAMCGQLAGASHPLAAMVLIAKTEGVKALYKGAAVSWLKLAPAAGLSFAVYELMKKQLSLA